MKNFISGTNPDRRKFLSTASAATVLAPQLLSAKEQTSNKKNKAKATSCILLWMGGGMSHLDTLDPKRIGDPQKRTAGSAYKSVDTAIKDVQVCEHLARTAELLDRGVIIRSLHHPLFVDHADSANLVKTGRITTGTTVYPSLGAVVSHELGPGAEGIPPYVVIGYPNLSSEPGFLGSRYGYLYLTDTSSGPIGLKNPDGLSQQRIERRLKLLESLRRDFKKRLPKDQRLHDYDNSIQKAIRLSQGSFPKVFQLESEPATLRNRYGSEFGQRCLLARRLVSSGVRFVEVSYNLNFVNGTGWDTHRHGQKNQHKLIQDLDQTLSTLVDDLQQKKLLDSTLVILATEFGRPAEFDNGGGRGHQSSVFSVALFGGGLKTGQVIGTTDELSKKPLTHPVSVPDLHATIHAALGINPKKELHDGDRPVPINDHGTPIAELFS